MQEMCCKLFEKVYSVFISHLKTKLYPALASIFQEMPRPLQEDDLDFGGGDGDQEKEGDEEEEKNEENSKSFAERIETWKEEVSEDMFTEFIPLAVKEFNEDFKAILEKMTLENLVPA